MPTEQQVIVTGASSGIGRAAALRFGRDGASVLLVGRSAPGLADVAGAMEREGGRSATDVTAPTRRRESSARRSNTSAA